MEKNDDEIQCRWIIHEIKIYLGEINLVIHSMVGAGIVDGGGGEFSTLIGDVFKFSWRVYDPL